MNGVTTSEEAHDIYTASTDRVPSSERRLVRAIRQQYTNLTDFPI